MPEANQVSDKLAPVDVHCLTTMEKVLKQKLIRPFNFIPHSCFQQIVESDKCLNMRHFIWVFIVYQSTPLDVSSTKRVRGQGYFAPPPPQTGYATIEKLKLST